MNPTEQLTAAVLAGDTAAVATALAAGADTNFSHPYTVSWDRECVTGTESLLQCAARGGQETIVGLLLAHGADSSTTDTVTGRSPLIEAAARGHATIVASLLAAGARRDTVDGASGHNALAAAIAGGHGAIARKLAAAGVPATLRALELACMRGEQELAELCLRGGIGARDASLLETAARAGQVGMVRWLLAKGIPVATAGPTALCEAANAGCADVVAFLVEAGVHPSVRNSYQWTPLHFAAYNADVATCEVLLRAGADPRAEDGTGKTALDWANEAGRRENATLLEEALRHG